MTAIMWRVWLWLWSLFAEHLSFLVWLGLWKCTLSSSFHVLLALTMLSGCRSSLPERMRILNLCGSRTDTRG